MTTPAAGLVREYIQRKILSKIGITSRLEDIDDFHVEAFTVIASEFANQEDIELKKSRKR